MTHALEATVTNLADNLTKTAEEYPDRPAVRLDDMVLTYKELLDGARRVSALLVEKGVGPGDRLHRDGAGSSRAWPPSTRRSRSW